MKPKLIYISGPMSGKPNHGFDLFNEAHAYCNERGWPCLNPASFGVTDGYTWADYMRRDIEAMMGCDAILLLPGWRESKGAQMEYEIAVKLGMATYTYPEFELLKPEGICEEADRLVSHDRQDTYGHPFDNFTHTGKLWAPILGMPEVTPEQVALCMVQVKVSRQCFKPKRDNLVDGCGYFKCLDLIAKVRADQD